MDSTTSCKPSSTDLYALDNLSMYQLSALFGLLLALYTANCLSLLQILALFGLCITLYAISIERKSRKDSNYQATCDLNSVFRCSKALTGEHSRMLGRMFKLPENHILNIPNTYIGLLFFVCVFFLACHLLLYEFNSFHQK